jgi:hypothetical protein
MGQFTKTLRNQTIWCRVDTSGKSIKAGTTPSDATILPRLEQIREDRARVAVPAQTAAASDTGDGTE